MSQRWHVRRIVRGLYDVPTINSFTGMPTSPDPHDVIDALTRKDKVRILVDGINAANGLGTHRCGSRSRRRPH